MANSLLTIDMVTKESLRIAHEKATFIKTINRDFDDSYAKTGAKIGDTLRIRNPNQYTRRANSRIMAVQDQTETSQSLTVATQDGVDMKWNSAERALSIDEFSTRYLEPAMSVLVSNIDADMLTLATKATYNVAGTAGTVVGASNDISALGAARAKLNQGLAPKGANRSVQFDSVTMSSVATAMKGLFQPTNQIEDAFAEGFIARTAMADFYENERTFTMTNGSDVTGSTDNPALVTDGGSVVDMHTLVAVATQVVGEVFTIAGVYACHPETKQSYGVLQQFTITAIGASTTTISPPTYLTGAKKNVVKSDSTTLLTTDFNAQVLTFVGAATTSYRQNLMYHKDAFTFVSADLPIMADAESCKRMTQDGLSLRVWTAPDIRNDELLLRIDMLYGFLAIRPAWACRITN